MARAWIRKDPTDDTGFPWHYSVEWPEPEADAMDYGSLPTHAEALRCALESVADTASFVAERERMPDWHAKPLDDPEARAIAQDLLDTPTDEWDGFGSQLELVASMVYTARAHSPFEMTPERWATVKVKFRGSYERCLEQAHRELADM